MSVYVYCSPMAYLYKADYTLGTIRYLFCGQYTYACTEFLCLTKTMTSLMLIVQHVHLWKPDGNFLKMHLYPRALFIINGCVLKCIAIIIGKGDKAHKLMNIICDCHTVHFA